jgi:hypothetical protein
MRKGEIANLPVKNVSRRIVQRGYLNCRLSFAPTNAAKREKVGSVFFIIQHGHRDMHSV